MPYCVNIDHIRSNNRLALVQLVNLNLRLLEEWRSAQIELTGEALDCESIMIMMAIIGTGAEKLARTGKLKEFPDLNTPVDVTQLRRCNLSSIAETTGLNRELVRRRVKKLEDLGFLERCSDCNVRVAGRHLQEPRVHASIEKQIQVIVAAVEQLRKDGVLCET